MNSFRSTTMTKTHSRWLVILVLLIAPLLAATPTATAQISKLSNIGTRGPVSTGDYVMIGGFIVSGNANRVIVRAIGPELGAPPYNVPNVLEDPTLELHDGTGALIASNDDWETTIIGGIITTDQVPAILLSGKAPTDPLESAIIATLPPGRYTAIVRGFDDTVGVALVEVYESVTLLFRGAQSGYFCMARRRCFSYGSSNSPACSCISITLRVYHGPRLANLAFGIQCRAWH